MGPRINTARGTSLHVERAESEGVVDDLTPGPVPPRSAVGVATATVLPVRHRARPGALLVALRVLLVEASVLVALGAGFVLLRWGGVL